MNMVFLITCKYKTPREDVNNANSKAVRRLIAAAWKLPRISLLHIMGKYFGSRSIYTGIRDNFSALYLIVVKIMMWYMVGGTILANESVIKSGA